MRKEVLIAIILGFIVGLFISYGIYTANRAVKKAETSQPPSETAPLPSPTPDSSFVINEPENNIVTDENEATVSGQAEPNVTVAILAEKQEELLVTDNQGYFSTQIDLISGLNEIEVVVISKAGEKQEKKLNVVYSTAKIE